MIREAWLENLGADLEAAGVTPRGVLHLGAHDGREVPTYRELGFDRIVLAEPLPDRAAALRRLDGVEVLELAIGWARGPVPFYVTGHDEASSYLRPKLWPPVRTIEVEGARLSDVNLDGLNVLAADVQGAEVEALSSGPLDGFEVLIVETTPEARYDQGAAQADVDAFLERSGFELFRRHPHKIETHVLDSVWRRP